MPAEVKKQSVRRNVAAVFAVFLLLNVVLVVFAMAAALAGKQPLTLFPEDTGSAVRLMILIVGALLSWGIGRWMFLQMLEGDFPPDESATGSIVLMLYLVMFFAGAVYLGPGLWMWQVLLLFVLILLTLFGLRAVLGAMLAIVVILLCLAVGATIYFLLV